MIETGLAELRTNCKPLALATAFEAPDLHDKLACIWLFALELDKAVLLPKESMLRLIRLQWWHDALESGNDHNVPLMRDLLALAHKGTIDQEWLFSLIEQWQFVTDEPQRLSECWSMLLQFLSGVDDKNSQLLGHNLFCVLQQRPDKITEKLSKMSKTQYASLMRACRYLTYRGEAVDLFEDGTLGFRLFGHMLFGSAAR